jgi:hypothetical protein
VTPDLGLLNQMTATPCLIEPFRNPVTVDEINRCLKKLLSIQEEAIRQAKRIGQLRTQVQLPELWILTPSLSEKTLASFGATADSVWESGLYRLPSAFVTMIVVIHQLPKIADTLWLRMLGRGRVQKDAIAEVLALPLQSQRRTELLRLLVGLKLTIETTPEIVDADQELIMALSQAYLEWEQATEQRGIQKGSQEGKQEGVQEGERSLIFRQLTRRLGAIPVEAESQIQTLSLEQLEALGEALLDFSTLTDLETWLQ